jgi:hypothetical protein
VTARIAQVASAEKPRSIMTAPVAPSMSMSTGSLLCFWAASTISFMKAMYLPATPSFSARASMRLAAGSFSMRPETPIDSGSLANQSFTSRAAASAVVIFSASTFFRYFSRRLPKAE